MVVSISGCVWGKTKYFFQKISWFVVATFFASMTIQSSGFASFNKIEYEIIITPDQFPIIWPKDDGTGEPVDYGQGSSLSASELLTAYICLSSANCTVDAINAGAVYYKVINVAGVGEVIFYYDELGKLVGTQRKSEITAYDSNDQENSNADNHAPNASTVDLEDYFGDYSQYAVGATSANFNVDPSGAASYEIPIYTPPGIGDLQPELSISYNSQAGNGLLGLGFNIGGLSKISRCSRTRAQDGISRVSIPPDFTNSDAFCIDGQRLILVSGTNGTNGAEYRTENESFSKITITAGNSFTPLTFKVETKSGQTFYYGHSDNSRIYLNGHYSDSTKNNEKIIFWAVENIYDVANNNIHFDYTPESGKTGYRPTKISYGATGYQASIDFIYESRSDSRAGYIQGFATAFTKRLNYIDVRVDGSLVRRYNPSYGSNNAGSSRISSIKECGNSTADSSCFSPITFDWSDDPDGLVARGKLSDQMESWKDKTDRFYTMDLNIDGQSDIVIGPSSNGNWYLIEGENNSLETNTNIASNVLDSWYDDSDRTRLIDMDGDGVQEFLAGPSSSAGNWHVVKKDLYDASLDYIGSVNQVYSSWSNDEERIRVIDVDGDGQQDILLGPQSDGDWHLMKSNGSSFNADSDYINNAFADSRWSHSDIGPNSIRLFDANGDGLQDILLGPDENGDWDLLQSTSSGFLQKPNYIQPLSAVITSDLTANCNYNPEGNCNSTYWTYSKDKAQQIRAVDVNGDGLQDIVSGPREDKKWYVMENTGEGFLEPAAWLTETSGNGVESYDGWHDNPERVFPTDVDGDGLTDFVIGPRSTGEWYWIKSTGTSLVDMGETLNAYSHYYDDTHRIHFGDFDGDGLGDIVLSADGTGDWYGVKPDSSPGNKIIGISNGPTPKTTIAYESLAIDNGPYSMSDNDSRAVPMYVVSSVSKGNGIGGSNSTTYEYKDLKFDLDGRGLKGFNTVVITDSATDSKTTTIYSQNYPTIGMPLVVDQEINNNLVSKTINQYKNYVTKSALTAGVADPLYVVNSKITRYSYEYGQSSAYKTIVTETGYQGNTKKIDNYGNVEWVRVTTTDAANNSYVKLVESTYNDNVSTWKLGRLATAKVTHTSPEGSIIRESSFTYNSDGLLITETVEPNKTGTNLTKTSTYRYDSHGLRERVDEIGKDRLGNDITGRYAETNTSFDNVIVNGKVIPAQIIEIKNALGEKETSWISLEHGGVVKHVGPNLKVTTTDYDNIGRAETVTNHLGVKSHAVYSWTNQNPVRSVYKIRKYTEGPSGADEIEDEQTVYYDALNREVRTQNRTMDGRFATKETYYNARGLVDKANRPYLSYSTPVWICFEYDALGRVIEENLPGANNGSSDCGGSNRAKSTTVYKDGLITEYTDALGRLRKETRNVMDKLVRVDEAYGETEASWLTYDYDPMQNLTKITDANGKVTELVYDANGRKTQMKDPSMGIWNYAYNSFDELEWQEDAKDAIVTMEYDVLGRMFKRIDGEGTWNWNYGSTNDTNAIGKLLSETGPNSFERSYVYNSNLQLTSTTLKQAINSNGLNQQETLTTSYTYDAFGRQATTTRPGGFVTENEYNRYGHMVAVKSPVQTLTTEAIAKLQARKAELETEAAAAQDLATTYMNRAISYQSSASLYESYAMGLLRLEGATSSGSNATKLYSAANRLRDISQELLEDAETAQNEALSKATLANNLEDEIKNGTSSEVYNSHRFLAIEKAEDARNLLDKARSIIDGIQAEGHSYTYGETASTLSQAETYINLAFDSTADFQDQQALADRYYRMAQSVGIDVGNTAATTWWRAAEADVEGRVTKSVYGNGISTDRTYDPNNGHLLNIATTDGVTELQSLNYEYDHLNNVKKRTDNTLNYYEEFDYDKLDRLTTATLHAGALNAARSWTHDKTGNIDTVDGNNYVYENNTEPDLANQLLNTPNQTTTFTYDANGNIENSGGRTYQYTSFNKPKSLSDGTQTALFTYGSDKSRINKVNVASGQATKTTVYFGGYEKITNVTTGDIEHKYHISAGGSMIAVYRKYDDASQNPVANYLHKDALGSVTLITDDKGAQVGDVLAYTPYGIRRNTAALATFTDFTSLLLPSFNPVITKRGYTGHEHIDELDLVHMNGRVYDPYIGRFLSPDPTVQLPKSTQNYSRYTYVGNNPLKYTDPTGYSWLSDTLKTVAGIALLGTPTGAVYADAYLRKNSATYRQGSNIAAGVLSAFFGPWVSAANSAYNTALTGGSFNDVVKSGAYGYVAASIGGVSSNWFGRAVAQGAWSQLQGGRFRDGFLGSVAQSVVQMPDSIRYASGPGGRIARTFFAALSGGISSKLGGGKFSNGAASAAFAELMRPKVENSEYSRTGDIDYSSEGTAEQRRAIFEQAKAIYGENNIIFEDFYAVKVPGQKEYVPAYSEKEVNDIRNKFGGGKVVNGVHQPKFFIQDKIIIYRSAVVGLLDGRILMPGGYVGGNFSGLQSAIITIGHEIHHRNGFETEDNSVAHRFSNKNGWDACRKSGIC